MCVCVPPPFLISVVLEVCTTWKRWKNVCMCVFSGVGGCVQLIFPTASGYVCSHMLCNTHSLFGNDC